MNQDALFAYIYGRVHNYHDAQDITQDVLFKAWKARATVREGARDSWLYRVAHNACVDVQRSTSRRHEETVAVFPDIPIDSIATWERREELQRVLAMISPANRRVMLLRHAGYSFEEIAGTQGISLSIAYSRYHSAQKQAVSYRERMKTAEGWERR